MSLGRARLVVWCVQLSGWGADYLRHGQMVSNQGLSLMLQCKIRIANQQFVETHVSR